MRKELETVSVNHLGGLDRGVSREGTTEADDGKKNAEAQCGPGLDALDQAISHIVFVARCGSSPHPRLPFLLIQPSCASYSSSL